MKHSIFKQTIAVFVTAIVLVSITAGIFSLVYNARRIGLQNAQYARGGASAAAQVIENVDLDKLQSSDTSEMYTKTRDVFRGICQSLELEYLYLYIPNQDEQNIRFIMTVASDDEKDKIVAAERGLNVVVPRILTAQEQTALNGDELAKAYAENNSFGNVYSWSYPVRDGNGNVIALIGSDYRANDIYRQAIQEAMLIIIPMIAVLLVVFLIELITMRRKIFVPVKRISNRMKGFVSEGGANFEPLNIHSGDEMQEIADSFEKMSEDISTYLNNIEKLTAERVQANVELEIASRIQCGIVPERTELTDERYEACAVARPAKEVGGDFYDCFIRNDGSVCVVIGDVSGKGVAAAMFMAMAKTMLKDCINSGLSPAEALNTANDALCSSNPEGMFATVFAAVLDTDSGVLHYANAGHTRPVIFGNSIEFLEVDAGIALGLFEDAGIMDCSVTLENNSGILIYTDGVTEAVNTRKEFFGEEQLLSAVQAVSSAKNAVNTLSEAVWGFVGEAEQFDDYTALALYYSGISKQALKLKPELSSLPELRDAVIKNADKNSNGKKIVLACEEVFVNIASYSNASCAEVSFENLNGVLTVEFSDDGVPFNPLSSELQDKEFEDFENGGMGIGLVKQLADKVNYRHENDMNILTLGFLLSEDGADK
ncbi:MAG: SpoIIE family protein phosphatase [Oscillospiraceae bacterium]|nr:SpoIIE family protein phosphatase [Oscillospiraceae bacterium]